MERSDAELDPRCCLLDQWNKVPDISGISSWRVQRPWSHPLDTHSRGKQEKKKWSVTDLGDAGLSSRHRVRCGIQQKDTRYSAQVKLSGMLVRAACYTAILSVSYSGALRLAAYEWPGHSNMSAGEILDAARVYVYGARRNPRRWDLQRAVLNVLPKMKTGSYRTEQNIGRGG
jgi:hypothetical protein